MGWSNDLAALLGGNTATHELKLGTMTGPVSCNVGNLQLKQEDLMFAEHLLFPVCTDVSETAPNGGGKCTDNSSYIPALVAGDTVLVYQLSDSKFLVIERMASL